jgi:APA family basic amino acid/polyamine antiporter
VQIVVVFAVAANPKVAFDTLTDFVILGGTLFYALTVAAVYVLRRKMPAAPRPYRTWGYPVTPALYLAAAIGIGVSSTAKEPRQVLVVVSLLALGLLVYAFFRNLEFARQPANHPPKKRKKRR